MKQVMIKIKKCQDCPNVRQVIEREEYSTLKHTRTCMLTGNELRSFDLENLLPSFCPLEDIK